jgi:hypothetical protein
MRLNSEASQLSRPEEDPGEHGSIEAAGVGVAQRWVIGGKKMQAVWEKVLGSVGEAVLGFAGDDASFEQKGQIAVEGDLSEADDYADARQGLDLGGEVRPAVTNLLGVGFVAGRGAADD